MQIYVNLIGKWTLLNNLDDNINGMRPKDFAGKYFTETEEYYNNPTICVTHEYIKYVVPISYLQIKDY